jgi:hypothetical protein
MVSERVLYLEGFWLKITNDDCGAGYLISRSSIGWDKSTGYVICRQWGVFETGWKSASWPASCGLYRWLWHLLWQRECELCGALLCAVCFAATTYDEPSVVGWLGGLMVCLSQSIQIIKFRKGRWKWHAIDALDCAEIDFLYDTETLPTSSLSTSWTPYHEFKIFCRSALR